MPEIVFSPDELRKAVEAVNALSRHGSTDPVVLEAQAKLELEIRKLLASIPGPSLKPSAHGEFLRKVRGTDASADILEFVRLRERALRLTDDQIATLEKKQVGRCASCGELLTGYSHKDHIHPLALGGEDEYSNIQLLCERCNSGKGALLHWVMGSPWFIWEPTITLRLRYCVLQRHGSRCSKDNCDNDWSSSRLEVDQIIPASQGGRPVFDNLTVLCAEHANAKKNEEYERARLAVRTPTKSSAASKLPLTRR